MISLPIHCWITRLVLAAGFAIAMASSLPAQLTHTFTRPVQESAVAATESGVIVRRLVDEGSVVRKGDILAELNPSGLVESQRLAELRAASTVRVRSAETAVTMKKTHLTSLQELLEKGHGNQRELDLAQLQYDTAVADHELAREQQQEAVIDLARITAELELRRVRSPIDGVVTDVFKELGEYIAANDPVFCQIVQTDRLRADFYLDGKRLGSIRRGDQVRVRIGSDPTAELAHVLFVSPTIDPKSGTGRITVEIDNAQSRFRSGLPCELLNQ